MRRGTNPIIKLEVNIDTTLIEDVYVTFKQNEIEVEKVMSDCTLDTGFIKTQLTQEETLSFKYGEPVQCQARIKMTDGTVCATNINKLVVYDILKDGVI